MKKKRRRSSHPTQEDLEESAHALHDAANDLVVDAARVWRDRGGIDWSALVLASAVDVLTGAKMVLGRALDTPPVTAPGDGKPGARGALVLKSRVPH